MSSTAVSDEKLGSLQYFLGIKLVQGPRSILLSQQKNTAVKLDCASLSEILVECPLTLY